MFTGSLDFSPTIRIVQNQQKTPLLQNSPHLIHLHKDAILLRVFKRWYTSLIKALLLLKTLDMTH